jgi:hypothetical protein
MVHLVVEDHSPIPDACFQAALIILLLSIPGGSLEWLCVVQTYAYHRTNMYWSVSMALWHEDPQAILITRG